MLAPNLGDGGVGIAVLAGVRKVIEVGGAPDSLAQIVKEGEGELFEDLLRRQGGGKTELRNVSVTESRISLILAMAGKRIA